ncbi:bifunctional glycosyltransferase family 2 protein/CDP-glycerol:glycerophosphate glycerophosphotransferase [Cytobacillus kochii]|uniref:bifunctional glycosyltransferase/CDP-glycerol:glycerophosphate glycerophosphotransferase n=1 Tax=Cytobacillus kochii TaxID=859143 RepID=UPI001CD23BF5|nr:bifunctional glycosyltransferase family 2 protein/CDP-glycerol:glycerophosphate glycerophosphotransferase [Cytobacillus kochii]MCA1026832.1 bifunctional glycosyltransferase family 2 protein/CDP-glycerol:glycerophosphate glycerophosphotransferase [Cytobacillus kochii]
MKKISVIIPVFNTAEFLSDSITSVLNQTYSNIELIIIDDGSTNEKVKEALYPYKTYSNVKIIYLNENKGVGYARNKGLDHATGEYIYFLDSDDMISSNTLKELISNINNSHYIFGNTIRIKNVDEIDEYPVQDLITNVKVNKAFNDLSILNCLLDSSWIKANNIIFNEDFYFYTDMSFIVNVLKEDITSSILVCQGAHYYSRLRNDPISNPSLLQMDTKIQAHDFLNLYINLKLKNHSNKIINEFLDNQLLKYYRKNHFNIFNDFEIYQDLIRAFDKMEDIKKQNNPFINIQITQLKRHNQKMFQVYNRLERILKDIKIALSGRTKFKIFLYKKLLTKLPLKKKTVVFESFLGKNYSDSPKNLYEYMLLNNKDFNFVWIFNERKRIPGNAKQIKRFSLKYYYYLATSKYWVSNSRMPLHLNKREGNIYLQTWHGTPLKKLVFDMNEVYSANPKYKEHFYKQSRRWDYLIAANKYSSDIFKRAFKFEKRMLEFGYPRNDVLHHPDKDLFSIKVKRKLNIPLDKKIITYAPTWRDDDFYAPGKYKFQLKLDLEKMKQTLGDEYVILLRMHYFIADNIDTSNFKDFVFNLSKYDDIADLYLISDILITDYSSVFFDYANLKRPILFYTYDLEKYRDTLRGFYIDMEKEVPGPLLKTTDEIINAIQNIDKVQAEFLPKYEAFYEKYCSWENGNASEKIVDEVFK